MSSKLEVKIFRKISDIPRADWDRVYPDVLEGYGLYQTLDSLKLSQFSFYYLVVYDGSTVVGVAPCFLTSYSLDTSIQGPLRRVLRAVNKIFPNILHMKTLMCGLPLGRGRIGIASDADPDRVVEVLYRAMEEEIAEDEKVAVIVFKDFESLYDKTLRSLTERHGFYRFEGLPTTEMDITFGNFEEYLQTLSYASRYDLRRKFRKLKHAAPIVFEEVSALQGELLDQAHAFYMETVKRHELGFEVLPKEFFQRMAETMPAETKYFLWRIGGKLVGFGFCLASKDFFLDYYVGFDYSLVHQYNLFFVRFRDLMNWCLAHGMKRYEMGYTSYEPKRRLGFGLVPLFIYVKHRSVWINRLLKYFCGAIRFENFDPALREMKKKFQ